MKFSTLAFLTSAMLALLVPWSAPLQMEVYLAVANVGPIATNISPGAPTLEADFTSSEREYARATTTLASAVYTSRASFDATNGNQSITNFDNPVYLNGTLNACNSPLSNTSGGCFAAGTLIDGFSISSVGPSNNLIAFLPIGASSVYLYSNSFENIFELTFPDNDIYGVGWDYIGTNGPDRVPIAVYTTGNQLLDTFSLPAGAGGGFVGVSSTTTPITRITYGNAVGAETLDNLTLSRAPLSVSSPPVVTCDTISQRFNTCPDQVAPLMAPSSWRAVGNAPIFRLEFAIGFERNVTFFGCVSDDNTSLRDIEYRLLSSEIVPGSLVPGCSVDIVNKYEVRDADGTAANLIVTIGSFKQLLNIPVLNIPRDTILECSSPTDPSITGQATATTGCGVAVVTFNDSRNPGTCSSRGEINRIWRAISACGTSWFGVQRITIIDTEGPIFSSIPADTIINCGKSTAANNFGAPVASDGCNDFASGVSGIVTISSTDIVTPGACPIVQTIARTFTATDACGNTSTAQQLITVQDTTKPVLQYSNFQRAFDACPDSLTPNPITMAWTQLSASATVDLQISTVGSTSVTLSSSIVDSCATSFTQFEYQLASSTFSVPAMGCSTTLTNRYRLRDACGNVADKEFVVVSTIQSSSPPVLSCLPNVTLECTEQTGPATTGTPTIASGCGNATITFTDARLPGACPSEGTIERTWTALAACGRTSTCVQNLTIRDRQGPSFSVVPRDTLVNCGTPTTVATFRAAVAADACVNFLASAPVPVVITSADVETAGRCPQEKLITRTFTAVDACGNATTRIQRINVQDIEAPRFVGLPTRVDFDCTVGLPLLSAVTLTDCDPDAVLAQADYNDVGNFLDLGFPGVNGTVKVIRRTYVATDACSNQRQTSRILRLVDFAAPQVTFCPPNIDSVQSNANGMAPVVFPAATFSDNCAFTVASSHSSGQTFPVGTTTVTFTATDAGGNQTSCAFTITVIRPLEIGCNLIDISIVQRSDKTPGEVNFPYAETDCEACPQGTPLPFLDYLGYYQGHRYYVSKPDAFGSWYGAHYYAIELGGRMAEVNDAGENQFIANEIPYPQAYIGLLRQAGFPDWRTTFTSSTPYRNWAPGSPSTARDHNFAVIRKADGKHVDVADSSRAYVLEFPCINFEVLGKPADGLYGNGANPITYVAVDQCGYRDTCSGIINVTNFRVNYCTPDLSITYPRERDLWLSGIRLGAFAKTYSPSDYVLQFRDTLVLEEDTPTALRLDAALASPLSSGFTTYYRVWIDANQDGDFYDAGEQLFQGLGNAELLSTLTLPAALSVASPTRLRIGAGRYAYPEPCGESPFVAYKDYPVRVLGATGPVPKLALKGAAVNGQPRLMAISTEDGDVERYLLLRGLSETQVGKYMSWVAEYGDGAQHSYDLVDADPVLHAFYQAVALNDAGDIITRSNIVEIRLPVRRGGGIKVYPNPAHDFLSLEREAELAPDLEPVDITLFDALGRQVLTRVWPANLDKVRLELPVLPSGTYLLQTRSPGAEPAVTRVVIEQSAPRAVPRA